MRDVAETIRLAEDAASLPSVDAGRTIDPIELERAVVTALQETLQCDGAALVRAGAPVNGRIPLIDSLVVGDADMVRRTTHLVREGGESRPLSFARRHPDGERFLPLSEVARLLGAETFRETWDEVRERHGIEDQLRVVFFDRGRVVAWLGAVSRHANAFDPRLLRRADALLPRLAARVRVADRFRRESAPAAAGDLVMTASGGVDQASSLGRAWLARATVREGLVELVALSDASREEVRTFHLAGALLRVVRTEGANGTRYLCHFDPIAPLECPAVAMLTDAQLGVARYAASGATVNEIAKTLGIAPGTVRVHLRTTYDRLGVANRVELSHALVGWDS